MDRCQVHITAAHSAHLWSQCPRQATDLHHMLSRSRGGKILDRHGERYHLIEVCRQHHNFIHQHPAQAREAGLTIPGYVMSAPDGKPWYVGTDKYLLEHYGVPEKATSD